MSPLLFQSKFQQQPVEVGKRPLARRSLAGQRCFWLEHQVYQVDGVHLPREKVDAAGAIGDHRPTCCLLCPFLGPTIGDIRRHETGRTAFPAAQGPLALMLHVAYFEPETCGNGPDTLMDLRIKPGGARIMNTNFPAGFDLLHRRLTIQYLVDGFHLNPLRVPGKDLVAAGADGDERGDAPLLQLIDLGGENSLKEGGTAEIMGRLGTAVEDDAQVVDLFFQSGEKFLHLFRFGAGQCAAWKEDSSGVLRDSAELKPGGQTYFFIVQNAPVLPKRAPPLFHQPAAHQPEHFRDIQSLGAMHVAEPAEAAGIDDLGGKGAGLVLLCQHQRITVALQKRALPHAAAAFGAVVDNRGKCPIQWCRLVHSGGHNT